MATDQRSKGSTASEITTTQATEQPRIVWGNSNIRDVYANVTDVTGTREEIILLFGESQTGHMGQKELRVQLRERVVLSPFAAKRLAILLNSGIQDYESKYGSLEEEYPQSPGPAPMTLAYMTPSFSKKERMNDKAAVIIQRVDNSF